MKKIRRQSVEAYNPGSFDLIPLHRPSATRERNGITRKVGKSPLDKNWTSKAYDSRAVLKRCIEDNRNVGVRLRSDQLVIDVDPRNGGEQGFTDLCLHLGLDDSQFPRVITGSGGSHYYMTKPADVSVVDTRKDFPGVEFKSKGRQVVAAGSIHPDTQAYYEWDDAHPSIDSMPEAPANLIRFIARPQRAAISGGGQYTQEQIAAMLEGLDPRDYQEHSAWLKLMMACHHASDGDARGEFIDWSIGDPAFANDAEIIGRRWDSLHREKNDGYTYKTLQWELHQHNASHLIPADDAAADFEAVDDGDGDEDDTSWLEGDDSSDSDESNSTKETEGEWLTELNAKYCTVIDGSKFRIVYQAFDPVMNRFYWVRMSHVDFQLLYGNRMLEKNNGSKTKLVPLGKAWLEWHGRRHVEGVVFDPERERPGYLNLWTGFAYEPSTKGSWDRLRELIFEVLADGSDTANAYILNWMAWLAQHPGQRAEAALVFRGGMGVGKGTLGNTLAKIIGRHAIAVASPELVAGRFNAHLQDVIFLFADEAIRASDKIAESRLRAIITEPHLSFEGKGRDVVVSSNVLHVMMASNDAWVVPAGMDERRFFVSDANTKWRGHFSKFEALHEELKRDGGSGYQRMLFDLLNHKLPMGWHPRQIPVTQALLDQKLRSMSPLRQFLFNALNEGELPFEYRNGPWATETVRCFAEDFKESFSLWCRNSNINPGGSQRNSSRFVLQELRQIFPNARTELRDRVPEESTVQASKSDGRAHAIEIPPLAECRAEFERQLRGKISWPGDEEDFG